MNPRPFRFSANVPTTVDHLANWREALREIEGAGFSAVAIADHFTAGYTLEPLVTLTAAAMSTSTLRLQTAVLGNDYRHPVLVHRMAATLDVLSEGRLELGLGAGWMTSDYEAADIPYDPPGRRIDRLEDTIAIVKGLFGPDPFSYEGKGFAIRALTGVPKSVQQPHPPILIGGGGRRMLRLAGCEADIVGINANLKAGVVGGPEAILDVSAERLAEKVTIVRDAALAHGRDPDSIELSMAQWLLHVTPSSSEAAAVLDKIASRTGVNATWLEGAPGVLVGSVGRCIEKLHELRERFGISYVQVDAGPRATASVDAVSPIVQQLAGT
jgi:probable F420-dependent oxidoreductase